MVKLKLKKNNNTFRTSRNFTWFLFYWNPDGKGLSYQENEKSHKLNFLSQNLNMERNFFKWDKKKIHQDMILPKFLQNLEKYTNILCVYFSFSSILGEF